MLSNAKQCNAKEFQSSGIACSSPELQAQGKQQDIREKVEDIANREKID